MIFLFRSCKKVYFAHIYEQITINVYKYSFLGKYLCTGVVLKKHDRLINVQNKVKKIEKTGHETFYAESNACRKQQIKRHLDTHGKEVSGQIVKKNNEKVKLNQVLALSRVGEVLPTYRLPQTEINLIYECCQYALQYRQNPISDGTIQLTDRVIKKRVVEMSENYQKLIFKLMEEQFDREKASIKLNKDPKWLLASSMDMDHVRISGKNYGAKNLILRKYYLATGESKVWSIPADLYPVRSVVGGKGSEENIYQIRTFLNSKFKKQDFTAFGFAADMGVIKDKFFNLLDRKENVDLKFLKFTSSMCTNHAAPLIEKHSMIGNLNNCGLLAKFSNMFPKGKVSNGNKISFWGNQDLEKDFTRNMNVFFGLIKIQTETDQFHVTFADNVDALQKEFIRKSCGNKLANVKTTIDSSLLEEVEELRNPHACHHVEKYRSEFFQCPMRIKPTIHKVQPVADLKQRRLVSIYDNMIGSSQYAIMVANDAKKGDFNLGKHFQGFSKLELDTDFVHKFSEYVGMQEYIKAEADSTMHSYNMPLSRYLNISFTVALRHDCENQTLPLSNPFTT